MALSITDKPNTDAPDGNYPYGNIRDNDGSNNGTPVNKLVYADFHQLFSAMMADAGIAFNGLPDNITNGFQLWQGFQAAVRNRNSTTTEFGTVLKATAAQVQAGAEVDHFISPATLTARTATETRTGIAEIATQAEVDARADDLRIVTALKLWNSVGVLHTQSPFRLQQKIVSIGVWNMVSDSVVDVAHGVADFTNIIRATALIRNDAGDARYMLNLVDTGTGACYGGVGQIVASTIRLNRVTGGAFDSANFNDGAIDRGIIVIEYYG